MLRLAGGQHPPGGVAGRHARCGHRAAARGDGYFHPALLLLTAGKSRQVIRHWTPILIDSLSLFPHRIMSPHHLKSVRGLPMSKCSKTLRLHHKRVTPKSSAFTMKCQAIHLFIIANACINEILWHIETNKYQ